MWFPLPLQFSQPLSQFPSPNLKPCWTGNWNNEHCLYCLKTMELRKIKMVSVVIYIYIKCCSDQSHKGGNFEDVVSIMLNYCKKTTKQTLSETFITSRLVDNSDNLGQNFCTCPFEKILQKSSKGPPLWNHHIFCFCSCCSFKVWNWFQCILCWLEKTCFVQIWF
jgi:hypothetical protein